MKKGKVKFFNESKGFGFIKDSESENEYFVHASGLMEVVKENEVGLLFRPGDPGELSRLLARMLGDADLRCAFSTAALQRVEEYEQNKVAKEFLRALAV